MAKVTLMAGIASLHGKIGDVYYRTMKNGVVVMCKLPQKRRKVASKKQQLQRDRFERINKEVGRIMQDAEQRKAMEILYGKHKKQNELFRSFLYRLIHKMEA